jgi:hypothetical protein
MAKRKQATHAHIVDIGYSHVAVPDEATLSALMKALARCQIVEESDGHYWRPIWRDAVGMKLVPADKLHLNEPRPRHETKPHAKPAPYDAGTVNANPIYDSEPEEPRPSAARRIAHNQLFLTEER